MFGSHADGVTATLADLHLTPVTIVAESDSLAEVAKTFVEKGISCAVLGEPPLRVVTDRDLVGAWADIRPASDEVALIATTDPCWVPATSSLVEAAAHMINLGVRHLVVVDIAGLPIGIVSMVELVSALVHGQEPLALYASFTTVALHHGGLAGDS
jgi:signal-transduction protein with cAMP-binding, CBS, and nucleotidyltransferase domain